MNNSWYFILPGTLLVLASALPVTSYAEITLLKADPQKDDLLSRLNFQVGGSIRPQLNHMTSGKGKNYKRNVFDGGTRFRFTADYRLTNDLTWTNYYELGVNIPALLDWSGHYAENDKNTTRRMMYTGIRSKEWGELTFGQRNSIYYDVIGSKTDIWDYDMLGQAPGNGINGDYDGSYRPRKQLRYQNRIGNVELYAAYLFADSSYLPGNGLRYKRRGGGSLGFNYQLTPDLSWAMAWNYTKAQMRNPQPHQSKNYNQNLLGTAFSWHPGHWVLAAGGGWYQNFEPSQNIDVKRYFAGDAWGVEYYAGYNIPVQRYALQSVQPYFMGDRMQFVTGRNYQRTDNGLGVAFNLDYGFRVDYEYVLTSSTDHLGNMNVVRIYYNF
ncbi:porin [Tatumella sp. JGM100]|uniref:Porin n=1 Tax=Tatumella punctata TaxID=399969 RepID=A0ABW1VMC4_9GAMM|nr:MULTISPECIES: porin [unclassified Tatumella]MBS0855296.1 porin [Tatumella sp. JGM16]MBS0876849.1 porin [Tatumella sp. JGM82]MBS0889726.1 porin [Tatumella sp. JGM94]MBS0892804.1 porin [Tatumella sp. JGM130]MBS0902816.1 porin [Tatumella sp. JGM100]